MKYLCAVILYLSGIALIIIRKSIPIYFHSSFGLWLYIIGIINLIIAAAIVCHGIYRWKKYKHHPTFEKVSKLWADFEEKNKK